MAQHTLRELILSVAGLVMVTMVGCSRWMELPTPPSENKDVGTYSLADTERVPLVIDSFRLVRNGAPQDPSTDMERRIANSVHETSLFSAVTLPGGSTELPEKKFVSARITVEENLAPHSWLSAMKGIVIGGSMFLLSPFINLEYGYSATLALELERWDGQVKQYHADSFGSVHYKLFGATPVMIDELKGHVTEACLTNLTKQLVRDTTLYMANSAPLPAGGIRMVTVKHRRPSAIPPTPSIVPVVTQTTP